MGPIPKELNLDRFVGQQLQQICMGAYDLQFRFEGDNGIRCTGYVTITIDGICHDIITAEGWRDPAPLAKIAGRDVASWGIESSHILSLTLIPEAVIRFISKDSQCENFIVDPEILVW